MSRSEESDSDNEDRAGFKEPAADWGKTKYNYYYTDYIDKDYPSSLTAKEERLATIEQEEALRIQKKLLSTLDNVNYQITIDDEADREDNEQGGDILEFIENQNKTIIAAAKKKLNNKSNEPGQSNKRKRVKFDAEPETLGSDECEFNSENDDDDDDGQDEGADEKEGGHKRRPINKAIRKNRGLTPYKKKEYRNPRVKHKLKYKKALSKRRHLVKEAQSEYYRYSGEPTGIKTSTIRSIRLC